MVSFKLDEKNLVNGQIQVVIYVISLMGFVYLLLQKEQSSWFVLLNDPIKKINKYKTLSTNRSSEFRNKGMKSNENWNKKRTLSPLLFQILLI